MERMVFWNSEENRDVKVNLLLPNDKSRVVKEIDFRCVKVEEGRPLVYVAGREKESSDPGVGHFAITSSNTIALPPYDFLESTTSDNDLFEFYRSDANIRKWSILKKWSNVAEMCKGVRLTDEQAEVPSDAGVLGTLKRRAGAQDGGFALEKRQVIVGFPEGQASGVTPPTPFKETVFLCPRKKYDESVQALSVLFASPIIYGDALTLHFDSIGKTKGSMVVSITVAIVD